VIRVALPLFDAAHYVLWMGVSQVLWMLAFSLFLWTFLAMLFLPRTDGQFG
jgi:uncharacterized protein involved in response to NO